MFAETPFGKSSCSQLHPTDPCCGKSSLTLKSSPCVPHRAHTSSHHSTYTPNCDHLPTHLSTPHSKARDLVCGSTQYFALCLVQQQTLACLLNVYWAIILGKNITIVKVIGKFRFPSLLINYHKTNFNWRQFKKLHTSSNYL